MTRHDDARDAALWRAAREMTRRYGIAVLVDRIDSAMVAIGGERRTTDGFDLDHALAESARLHGIDAEPLPLTRDTIPTVPQYDSDEGGL